MNKAAVMAAIVLGAMSCAKEEPAPVTAGAEEAAGLTQAREVGREAGQGSLPDLPAGTKRIVTTDVDMVVESFDKALASLRKMVNEAHGNVSSSSTQRDDEGRLSGTVEVRVPSDAYDGVMKKVAALGEVRSTNEKSEDVTEEYVDLEARLANARRLESRIIELLEARTGTIEDVLAVEKELASVREDIERIEGRIRFLDARTDFSTINVSMRERGAAGVGERTTGQVLGRMVDQLGVVFAGSVGALLVFAVGAAPWLVAVALVVLVVIVVVRISRRRKAG